MEISDLRPLLAKNIQEILGEEVMEAGYWEDIASKITDSLDNNFTLVPSPERIFVALNTLELQKFRVLIIGQDPYPTVGDANGFAFSVSKGRRIPKSLANIFQEIENEYGIAKFSKTKHATNGDLKSWTEQGVLLLNTVPTIGLHRIKKPDSHRKCGWEHFTEDVLKALDKDYEFVVLAWGNDARSVVNETITRNKDNVIFSGHPSPINTTHPFVGCGCFRKCNERLLAMGLLPIKWTF